MEPFLGQILLVGFGFAPRGWALCDGQLLPISQNTALFSLLGTRFGGDGETTFALPDLRGRSALHVGTGAGLSPVQWGQRGGGERKQILVQNMPAHNHVVAPGCHSGASNSDTPVGNYPAVDEKANESFRTQANTTMGQYSTANAGGNQPLDVRNPYLGVYHIIALVGIFPSRS